MHTARQLLFDSLHTGSIAGAATTLAVAALGKVEDDNAIAPLNAVSHIVFGDRAAKANRASWKYTFTGLLLNWAAVTSWAAMYEYFFGRAAKAGRVNDALLGGAVISGIAYVTDYHVVPKRLTPGFEKRLSNGSLFAVYAALALGLAIGGLRRP